MPIRPKEHALEDLSPDQISTCSPLKFGVYRDKDKDYGIDGEVEIFNEDGSVDWTYVLCATKRNCIKKRFTNTQCGLKN